MLIRVRRERRDALTLPIRWQVSIKVTPITAASGLPLTLGCPGRQLRVGGLTSAPGRPWLPVGSAGRGMVACPPAPPGLRSLLPLCLLGTSGSSPFPIVLGAKVPLRIFLRPERCTAQNGGVAARNGQRAARQGRVFLYLSITWAIALSPFPPLPNRGNCPSHSWRTGKGIGLVGSPGSASSGAAVGTQG